jgi:hypothetical protein
MPRKPLFPITSHQPTPETRAKVVGMIAGGRKPGGRGFEGLSYIARTLGLTRVDLMDHYRVEILGPPPMPKSDD